MKPGQVLKVPTVLEVKFETLENMLIGAFEGGSNYWYCIEKKVAPLNWKKHDKAGVEKAPLDVYETILQGGFLIISDKEDNGKKYRLDLGKIKTGLAIMAKHEARHFADMINENDDATTADVFLQCCVFQSKSIYG